MDFSTLRNYYNEYGLQQITLKSMESACALTKSLLVVAQHLIKRESTANNEDSKYYTEMTNV